MRHRKTTSDLRRVLLAGVLVVLSLIAHSVAAGSLPSFTAVVGGAIVAGVLSWSVADRRRSVASLVAILFAGQLLMHAVVVALGHHGLSYLPDLQMTLAHLVAAGIAAVLFARGEQVAATWMRTAAKLLGAPRLLVLEIVSKKADHAPQSRPMFLLELLQTDASSRRGPPNRIAIPTFA